MKVTGSYLEMIFNPVAKYTNKVIDDVSKKIDDSDNNALKYLK